MPPEEKFAWILAGGCTLNQHPNSAKNNRVLPPESPVVNGESVSPIRGQKKEWNNRISFDQFKDIESQCLNDLHIYTDGSALGGLAGHGVVIFAPQVDRPIYTTSQEIGETTNNVAELEAIHHALQWVIDHHESTLKPKVGIHIFTDSQYSRDALLSAMPHRKNFLLIESALALGAKLHFDLQAPVTLHWVPSHIEKTIQGYLPIEGNCKADKLAQAARKRCRPESSKQQTIRIQAALQNAISDCLQALQKIFRPEKEEHNSDGPPTDDFAFDASQEPPNASSDI